MQAQGKSQASGSLNLVVIRGRKPHRTTLLEVLRDGFPRPGLSRPVMRWRLRNCWRLVVPALKLAILNRLKVSYIAPSLRLNLSGVDLGLASLRLVTDAGVAYIVDALQGTTEPENLKFHGFGTGTTAESAAQTALVTEETTQYAPDNTRPTGSLAEGATANIFRTVGTYAPDTGGTRAITEHGIFSQAATGGGTMLDRSVFSAVNLVAGSDSLQATYEWTLPSGG